MDIRTEEDLRCAYELLMMHKDMQLNYPKQLERSKRLKHEQRIKELKVDIRAYHRMKALEPDNCIIAGSVDGAIFKTQAPKWCKTEEDCNEWFLGHEYRECKPSQYDCTGQLFTTWYSFHKLHGHWYAYHAISLDI